MKNFTHCVPTKFVFGRGAEDEAGAQVAAFGGTKALIHYGGGSAVRSGLIARAEKSLDAAGIAHVSLETGIPVLFGILTTENIEQAIERAGSKVRNKGYDCALSAIEMVNVIDQL